MNLQTVYINGAGGKNNNLLENDNWKKVTFYKLSTDSTFWNMATLLSLPKIDAATATEACLYLLQAEAKQLQIWETVWDNHSPSTESFIKRVIAERRFTNNIGKEVTPTNFWKAFTATIEGITAEASFECTLNEVKIPYKDILLPEDIFQVICFDENWQEQNYFIETAEAWMLFHWSTGM